ncbi:hypothetical protein [Nonomuraea sp. NPDC050691]|uniref:hypothetical protein n=1 Tax=Nonomuraea sp. NPDC050691 TaxID=3155661 RepID=UPI0033ED8C44
MLDDFTHTHHKSPALTRDNLMNPHESPVLTCGGPMTHGSMTHGCMPHGPAAHSPMPHSPMPHGLVTHGPGSPALTRDDPMAMPLTYPGLLPQGPGVLADRRFLPLTGRDGDWHVEGSPIDTWLAARGAAPMRSRHAVVAVGSNAAPAQLHRKFTRHRVPAVVPLTRVRVRGLAPGVSAHISRFGYIPAAPVAVPGVSELFVSWVDGEQLAALDRTEPNYRRRVLDPGAHPVTFDGPDRPAGAGQIACHVYEGLHGCLADESGRPVRLTSQRRLIGALLGASAELARVCGGTPEEFVVRVRDPRVRETAQRLLRRGPRVPGTTRLAA